MAERTQTFGEYMAAYPWTPLPARLIIDTALTPNRVIDSLPLKPRLGWICSRCGRSLSPDVTACACETCGE